MPAFCLYMTINYTWHALCLPFSLTKYVIRMPPPAGVPDTLCHESGAVSRGGKRRSVNGAAFFARRHPNTKKARHFYRALIVIIGYNSHIDYVKLLMAEKERAAHKCRSKALYRSNRNTGYIGENPWYNHYTSNG